MAHEPVRQLDTPPRRSQGASLDARVNKQMIARHAHVVRIWPHFLIAFGMIVSLCWSATLIWLLSHSVTTGVRVLSASVYSSIETKHIGATTGQKPKLYGLKRRA